MNDDEGNYWPATFAGVWLVMPDDPETRGHDPKTEREANTYWGVARVVNDNVVVYSAHASGMFASSLEEYDSLADIEDRVPANIWQLAQAADAADRASGE